MKKITVIMITMLFPVFLWGQAQINTKKVKIGDFTEKITKVVLTGNQFMDGTIQDEITLRWRISPYEFCSYDEFKKIRTDDNYYFLLTTDAQFRKDESPSIQFLTLVKGGPEAEKGIHEMLEVISVPIASAKFPTGGELIFLPAFLDIIQDYTMDAMENDKKGYGGLAAHAKGLQKSKGSTVVFSEDDLNESISEDMRNIYFGESMVIRSEEDADQNMIDNTPGVIVSYIVAPFDAAPGSFCYKMLIDSGSHELYYFKKDRISKTRGPGFLPEDISRVFKGRK